MSPFVFICIFILFVLFVTKIVTGKSAVFFIMFSLVMSFMSAVHATKINLGIEDFDMTQGVSIRQESTTRPTTRTFFSYYNSRSHAGGGLSGGK